MSEKNEALRLADALDDEFTQGRISNHTGRKSAAELRRLYIDNEAFGLHLSERMKDLARVEAQRDEARRTVREAHEAGTRLTAQRDALLEALKLARPYISTHTLDGYHAEVKADAAIKAVEGEQK